MMESYSPTDFIMISPEVYQVMLSEFGATAGIAELLILVLQVLLLLWLIVKPRSLPQWHLKALMISQILEWGLLAAVFYPAYFSEVAWYWPWLLGICAAQIFLIFGAVILNAKYKENVSRWALGSLFGYIIVQGVLCYLFPDFTDALLVSSPIQAAMMALVIAAIIKPPIIFLVLSPIPLLFIAHGLLLMVGR